MCACAFNRVENVKFWLKEFPNWNLEERNTIFGATALAVAIFVAPKKFKLAETLLQYGARPDVIYDSGVSSLISACRNEDVDPNTVRLLLSQKEIQNGLINYRSRARVWKWRGIRFLAKTMVRYGLTQSVLLRWVRLPPSLSFSPSFLMLTYTT